MDWCKVFMWIGSICAFAALLFERFLPQIVATLAFVGITILVVIVVFLMDEE